MPHAPNPILLFAALVGVPATASAFDVRVHDVVARPGQTTAVVLSTYEPQPIEQGQLCVRFDHGAVPRPDRVYAHASQGDAVVQATRIPSGELMIDLASASATINAEDGPMVVLYFEVPATAQPGATFHVEVDGAASWLRTNLGRDLVLTPRGGEVLVVDGAAPVAVLAEGDNVRPGQTARLSVETLEPMPLSGGEIALRYDPSIAAGWPRVTTRSRSAELLTAVDVSQQGLILVQVSPFTPTWNLVPGPLIEVELPTRSTVPIGTESLIQVDAGLTNLVHRSGQDLPLRFDVGDIEFRR